MDPKLSGLDPKLREAYERVMAGPATPPTAGATPPQPNPNPVPPAPPVHQTPNPVVPPPPPIMPSQTPVPPPPPTANLGAAQAQTSAPSPIGSTVAFNAHNSSLNKGTANSKTGGGMKVMLIVMGAILFLIFYTFIWVYLFHLKIPFIG